MSVKRLKFSLLINVIEKMPVDLSHVLKFQHMKTFV